jgi:hypothetical protein
MPTSDYEDEEVEELYDRIEDILEEDGKGDTNTIIMGDWNSVVGDKPDRNICGPYGLGKRNKRVSNMVQEYSVINYSTRVSSKATALAIHFDVLYCNP